MTNARWLFVCCLFLISARGAESRDQKEAAAVATLKQKLLEEAKKHIGELSGKGLSLSEQMAYLQKSNSEKYREMDAISQQAKTLRDKAVWKKPETISELMNDNNDEYIAKLAKAKGEVDNLKDAVKEVIEENLKTMKGFQGGDDKEVNQEDAERISASLTTIAATLSAGVAQAQKTLGEAVTQQNAYITALSNANNESPNVNANALNNPNA